jgi:hypothetical protein
MCCILLTGLYHFDASFRPVPLQMTFVGVSEANFAARNALMTEICYKKVRGVSRPYTLGTHHLQSTTEK